MKTNIIEKKQKNGQYPGKVEEIEGDPEGDILRVKVRVFEFFSDDVPVDDLPWSEYHLPCGARENQGVFLPLQVGDYVWVSFPFCSDTRRPKIEGSLHYAPDAKPLLPHEAWKGDDEYTDHKRKDFEEKPADREYHKNPVISFSGVLAEIYPDGTLCITNKETGTAFQIHKNGDVIIHSEKALRYSTKEDSEGEIGTYDKKKIGEYKEQEIGTYDEKKTGTYEKEEIGTYVDKTVGMHEKKEVGTYTDKTVGTYENKNVGTYSAEMIGTMQNTTVGANINVKAGGVITILGAMVMIN